MFTIYNPCPLIFCRPKLNQGACSFLNYKNYSRTFRDCNIFVSFGRIWFDALGWFLYPFGMNYRDALAYNMRRWRRFRDLTQSQLADKIGKKRQHISAIENGRRPPNIDLLEQICAELQISPNDLLLSTDDH